MANPTFFGAVAMKPFNVTTATVLMDGSKSGKVTTLNRAGGIAVTLPAATGSGLHFKFFVGTTYTTAGTIKVANASDTMSGVAIVLQDSADTMVGFETASTSDTVTLNGTTTGGLIGDFVELIDVAANKWYVRVNSSATGTEATPFSATV